MRKYLEPAVMICLALVLGLTFKSESIIADMNTTPLNEVSHWPLDIKTLRGDTTIHIPFDPFFKAAKTYRAFPLTENLEAFFGKENLDTSLQVIFECADGYKPHMSLEMVLAGNGYLAYRDIDAPEGQHWPDSVAKTLSPLYLVWPGMEKGSADYVTPYALVGIGLKKVEEEFTAAMPESDLYQEGYELFSNTCMKCHSVNKVGGAKGPELNYPKNITEYWTKENIWSFIQDPTSFRYSSKMPPMKTIDREGFEKIYNYLESMKKQKLTE